MGRTTISHIAAAKGRKKITMLTAYDYWTSHMIDEAGVDMMLVGDSVGMVIQGRENTLEVTVDDIVYHCRAVSRGRKNALVVGDMPYMSYHVNNEETVRNAGRIVRDGRADAVKLEGGRKRVPAIRAILDAEIPVMGHIGLTPQSIHAIGGFKVQGKDEESRRNLMDAAKALQDAGVFALVMECIPYDLAEEITAALEIPTIGIGAGPHCDGQVLVTHDMLGLGFGHQAKFVRRFAELGQQAGAAIAEYVAAVEDGSFPSLNESYRSPKKESIRKIYGGG